MSIFRVLNIMAVTVLFGCNETVIVNETETADPQGFEAQIQAKSGRTSSEAG